MHDSNIGVWGCNVASYISLSFWKIGEIFDRFGLFYSKTNCLSMLFYWKRKGMHYFLHVKNCSYIYIYGMGDFNHYQKGAAQNFHFPRTGLCQGDEHINCYVASFLWSKDLGL